MTDLRPGDIVNINRRRHGPWIVVRVMGEGERLHVRQALDGTGAVVGFGDVTMLHRPDLGPGRDLIFGGKKVTTVAEIDDETVRVHVPESSHQVNAMKDVRLRYEAANATASRAGLVSENLETFLQEAAGARP
jgi:hypothetical protein